jgi:peptidoglycan/xylan/chitin deacetylase (PgdA/CDA1 family)
VSDRTVVLTFDVEEFDVPDELGYPTSLSEKIGISRAGTNVVLDLLAEQEVKATLFTTARFALEAPDTIKRMVDEGHEVASHSYFHDQFSEGDLLRSKMEIEKISGTKITGFRMPRMMPVSIQRLKDAGYKYDSSVNPTYIPGRYNNLSNNRTIHSLGGLIEVPASVTPLVRFPLFWISAHVLPQGLFQFLCNRTLSRDGYLNLYLHPWEFVDLRKISHPLPWYMTMNSGPALVDRLRKTIAFLKSRNAAFSTMNSLVEKYRPAV